MTNKKEIKVTYKVLNNKSRKGTYAYVKEPKIPGKYYKVNPEIGKKNSVYKDIYLTGGIKGKKGVTASKIKQRRIALRTLKKYPNIEESLKSGYAQTTVHNAERLTPYGYKTAYMNLLRNTDKKGDGHGIVRDKELLGIITLPENVEKWKRRIMYKVNLYDHNNSLMGSFTPLGIKNLSDIKKELLSRIKLGQEFSNMYRDLSEAAQRFGYTMDTQQDKRGRITNVKIVMVFKKA